MAEGTFLKSANFSDYNGSHFYSELRYKIKSTDTPNNRTTVTYYLYVGSTDGYSGWGASATGKIGGSSVGSLTSIGANAYILVGSRDITYTHEDDGTKTVSYSSSFETSWGGVGNSYISGNLTLPKIDRYPQLLTATNFNDEQNPTITYTTIMGFQNATLSACISKDGSQQTVPYRQINVSDGQYTFNLTEQERNSLRSATPNSTTMTVYFYIRTTANGTNYYSSKQATMVIRNATPTFTFTSQEQNAKIVSLLGSDSGETLIANLSELKYTYTPTTYKSATVKNFVVSEGIPGHLNQSFTLTNSPYTHTFDVTGGTYSGKFVHVLTDSRNLSRTIEDNQRTLIDYDIVKINSYSFKRESQTSSNIILNAEFNYWGDIGTYTNTPVVKYKLDDGSWVTIPSTNYVINTTTHKLTITNYNISNILPYTSQGQFSISIEDILTSKTDTSANGTVLKGIPTFEYGEHDLQVNGDLYIANTDGENAVNILPSLQKHIITAFFTSNHTLTSSNYETLPLANNVKVGSKLTLSTQNNVIVIGNDVSKVKISAKVSFNSVASSGVKWLTIYNGTSASSANPMTLSARSMIYATDTVIEVQSGDSIALKVQGTSGDVIRSGWAYTNITVEVVE